MKVAIMQPYFFPYIGYFQLINAVDVFVIYDDVNYIKKGWINRNTILVNGKGFLFNIPLQKASQNKVINQIIIEYNSTWKINLLKTITFSYKKAPFYTEVFPIIKNIIEHDEKNLAKFITHSLREICCFLSISTTIVNSSDIEKNNDLKAQNKIIEICKMQEADSYINAIGGTALYNKDAFIKSGLSLNFIKSKAIIYPQFKNEFIPWLSIIDVLMFNTVTDIKKMLNQYELL